jgi:hypothetical protein
MSTPARTCDYEYSNRAEVNDSVQRGLQTGTRYRWMTGDGKSPVSTVASFDPNSRGSGDGVGGCRCRGNPERPIENQEAVVAGV